MSLMSFYLSIIFFLFFLQLPEDQPWWVLFGGSWRRQRPLAAPSAVSPALQVASSVLLQGLPSEWPGIKATSANWDWHKKTKQNQATLEVREPPERPHRVPGVLNDARFLRQDLDDAVGLGLIEHHVADGGHQCLVGQVQRSIRRVCRHCKIQRAPFQLSMMNSNLRSLLYSFLWHLVSASFYYCHLKLR